MVVDPAVHIAIDPDTSGIIEIDASLEDPHLAKI